MIPSEAQNTLLIIQRHLKNSLIGFYLHGSAVKDGLQPHSDVDVIAVINKPLTTNQRQHLVKDLLEVSGHYPYDPKGRRPLELIIFLNSDLALNAYPARAEFMYGEWLRAGFESGEIPQPISDPDLTLVLAQARTQALSLIGPEFRTFTPEISKSIVNKALNEVLPNLINSLNGDERNVILTLARIWHTSATGEFVSKDAAALWAEKQIPIEQSEVLIHARNVYLGACVENWEIYQTELKPTIDSLVKSIYTNLI